LDLGVVPLANKSVIDPDGFGNVNVTLANHFDHIGNQKARDRQSGHEQKKKQAQSAR